MNISYLINGLLDGTGGRAAQNLHWRRPFAASGCDYVQGKYNVKYMFVVLNDFELGKRFGRDDLLNVSLY